MIWALAYGPALAGLAIWALGGSRGRVAALGTLAALATLGLAWASGGATGRFAWSEALALHAALPPLAAAVSMLVPAILVPITVFACAHEDAPGLPRLVGLMLVFAGGMELLVMAADLVTLLIGWEIVGACSWALIGHRWRDRAPGRSADFAFTLTRAGDLGLYVAILATYAGAGGVSYAALGTLSGPLQAVAVFGILVAAASKAGQVPFAPWLFRAMDGPTSVSALLHSATMVAAGVYALARLHPHLADASGFAAAVMSVGLVTAILGGAVALRQVHAKRLLAGSTTAQMGLMIATVGAGFPGIGILHLIVHAATKAALFCAAGIAHGAAGTFDLRRMALGRALPLTASLAAVAALSLAAVPPLSGGWSKEAMVKAVDHAGPVWAAAAILAGGLSAAYAARFAFAAFRPGAGRNAGASGGERAGLIGLAGAVLALSALWLPAVHDTAAAWLGARLPEGSRLGLLASMAAVAIGLLAGLRSARTMTHAPAGTWLGLAAFYDRAVIRPFQALARKAARIDDTVLDLVPRGAAVLARGAGDRLSRTDDGLLDGLTPGDALRSAAAGARLAHGLVATAVRMTVALAALGGTAGERLCDRIPAGSARIAGMAGADLRRLQSGLVHHYYAFVVAGFGIVVAVLLLGT